MIVSRRMVFSVVLAVVLPAAAGAVNDSTSTSARAAPGQQAPADEYQILWQSVNDAGGSAANENFQVEQSAGLIAGGEMSNEVYSVGGGFWYGVEICDCGVWGDVSGDGLVNPIDVVRLVLFVYKNQDQRQPLPDCPHQPGDVNCSGAVNPVDVVAYVNYVYKGIVPFPCSAPCE